LGSNPTLILSHRRSGLPRSRLRGKRFAANRSGRSAEEREPIAIQESERRR
jgi:hypothetical protein